MSAENVPSAQTEALDVLAVFVLGELVPEYTAEANDERRVAAQAVWRRHRDEAVAALDVLEKAIQ